MKQATSSVYLSDLSSKDRTWDKRRSESDGIKALYVSTEYHDYATRIANCSLTLDFAFQFDDNGLGKLKLQAAWLCRCRQCAVCQGRRALKWTAKTIKIMPKVLEAHPKSRFIMLTLTVENCPLTELRSQLTQMHHAWTKLVKRKDWKVQGWIRATEVTRSKKDDTAHPHYHCLLMVKPTYFAGANYISQERWRELWRESLKASYDPWVNVRSVKARKGTSDGLEDDPVIAAVVETVKYTVKPSDILRGDNCQLPGQRVRVTDQEWLIELTRQMHKTRAIATGGILKDYLKVLEDERDSEWDDLVHINEDGEYAHDSESPRVRFNWEGQQKRYAMGSE